MSALAKLFYDISPIIEQDGDESWIVPWSDIKENYPATYEAYMDAVSKTRLSSIKEAILDAAKFEDILTDTLWMPDFHQGTVVDTINWLLGEEK